MRKRVLEMLNEIRPEFDFESSQDYIEDGYLDSFDITTLVIELENEFGVIINGLDVSEENFQTADAMCALVEKSEKRII